VTIALRQWQPWLLVVSLLANLTLAGLLVGGLINHGHPPPHDFVRRVTRDMNAADARVMEESFKQVEAFRSDAEHGRSLIERSRSILQQPVLDRDAYAATIEAASRNRREFDSRFTAALLDAAGKLSPEGRKILATWRP
jgi:uncharacterized membrane protein